MSVRNHHRLLGTVLILAFGVGYTPRSTQCDEVQKPTGPAVSREALPGGDFNKFFPKAEGDYDLVFTQEKTGYAEARLKKEGNAIATLSVFDTLSNPEAAEKFSKATESLGRYPLVAIGKQGTAVLVADRFQVQVRSTPDSGMGADDRKEWLKKFDLKGISSLREAVSGGVFNKFFPKAEGDYDVVFTQKKIGYAEARLEKKGDAIATLSVFDTLSNPEAANKYSQATESLGRYPLVAIGKQGTAVLVADRFQVQVRSRPDSGMGADDRKEWLKKFDLKSISNLR
jgi:hypothetical protein